CGSRSQRRTRWPSAAARYARFTAVVVFPTPPFMLWTATVFIVSLRSQPSERPPTGRPRATCAELSKRASDFVPQPLALITALLGHPPDDEQCVRRSPVRAQILPALQQPFLLDIRIVEVAEHALQFLERTEDVLDLLRVVKGRCHIEEISQFLCVNPDLVNMR